LKADEDAGRRSAEEGLWKRQRAVLRRALSVGKVGACRRGSEVRCGDGSGVRVVLCIPILPGNGGDHGIYARTYVSLADVQEEEGHHVCNMYRFVTGQLCNVAGVFVWPE
jgi:hypothetical protein